MPLIRVRPFNHIGPRQRPVCDFDFAKQIAEIEKTGRSRLFKLVIAGERDFTDVRDMVKAYVLILEKNPW